ncbi:ABC transporter permease [Gleimia hominis]|uniref:ABC transporter permease n=1 Tax=Gleimia hominis TaxID=595468 RepID=UPI0011AFCF7E|nr:ABC transporter permease [Gleimia hominis]WIK64425.1 ABC transporter permease [Gleimia hominis]
MRNLRSTYAMTVVETRLFLREPFALFFSIAFPLILLLFVGSIGGTTPVPGGGRFIDSYMAVMVGVTAANVGLMGMSIHIAENRGQGVLKRYRLSPLPAWGYFAAQFFTALIVLTLSILALAIITFAIYGPPQHANWLAFIAVSLLSLYVTMSYGIFLGGLPLPVRSVQVISAAVFFLAFFASGAALPRDSFPDWLHRVSDFNPLTILNESLMNSYINHPIDWLALGILVASTVIVNLICFRVFDWEGNH